MADYLQERFPVCAEQKALLRDMLDFLECKISKDGWLWFGLSQEDWPRLKGDDGDKKSDDSDKFKRCGTQASHNWRELDA